MRRIYLLVRNLGGKPAEQSGKEWLDDELVPLPPIKELGNYIERTPAIWCITNSCKYPEAVYKYFIDP